MFACPDLGDASHGRARVCAAAERPLGSCSLCCKFPSEAPRVGLPGALAAPHPDTRPPAVMLSRQSPRGLRDPPVHPVPVRGLCHCVRTPPAEVSWCRGQDTRASDPGHWCPDPAFSVCKVELGVCFHVRLCEAHVKWYPWGGRRAMLTFIPSTAVTRAHGRLDHGVGGCTPQPGASARRAPAGLVRVPCPGAEGRAFPTEEKTAWAPHSWRCLVRRAGTALDSDGITGDVAPWPPGTSLQQRETKPRPQQQPSQVPRSTSTWFPVRKTWK